MSNKNLTQSLQTRQKISLDKLKDRTELIEKIKEYIETLPPTALPTITSCAIYSGISEKALLAYELRTPENSDVRILLDLIRDMQKESLIQNGLVKRYDSKLTTFLLQAHHGMKTEAQNLTQNNIFNVSPDILAEALALSRTQKTALKSKPANNDEE